MALVLIFPDLTGFHLVKSSKKTPQLFYLQIVAIIYIIDTNMFFFMGQGQNYLKNGFGPYFPGPHGFSVFEAKWFFVT